MSCRAFEKQGRIRSLFNTMPMVYFTLQPLSPTEVGVASWNMKVKPAVSGVFLSLSTANLWLVEGNRPAPFGHHGAILLHIRCFLVLCVLCEGKGFWLVVTRILQCFKLAIGWARSILLKLRITLSTLASLPITVASYSPQTWWSALSVIRVPLLV